MIIDDDIINGDITAIIIKINRNTKHVIHVIFSCEIPNNINKPILKFKYTNKIIKDIIIII